MNTTWPREYLTLPIGEEHNYSEVYGMRLTSADSCPNNGARENCPCVKDDTHRAGVTGWSKIMLNITRLTVNCKYWGSIPENKMLEHYLQLMITPSQESCWRSAPSFPLCNLLQYGQLSAGKVQHQPDTRLCTAGSERGADHYQSPSCMSCLTERWSNSSYLCQQEYR